ncbi:MAG TPA: hypothetical protein VGD16_06355 [Enterovirga sp.]
MVDLVSHDEGGDRREWVEALRTETNERHAAWKLVLEPAHGCTFSVYTQNPYSDPEHPEAYAAEIRVSRPSRDKHGRFVRLEPLVPGDRTRLVFGDDEIYVANYLSKKPYDYERPYYDGLGSNTETLKRPPAPEPTAKTSLSKWLRKGCFHCVPREGLFKDNSNVLLAARGNPIQAPDFGVAMVYATARRALDIWKVYLNWDEGFEQALAKPFRWHFREPRLEIVPAINDGTPVPKGIASSGFGFVQLGCGLKDSDSHHSAPLANASGAAAAPAGAAPAKPRSWYIPYWINPDVLVHEIGHQILYASLGFGPAIVTTASPPVWRELWGGRDGDDFRAFHEAFSDIVAVLVSMHHQPFLKRVLDSTDGDLFSENAATKVGEISARKTIRNTLNNVRLADVGRPGSASPSDPPEWRYYQLSQVLSGALFDVLAGFSVHYLAEYNYLRADLVEEWDRAFDPDRASDAAAAPERELSDEVQAIYRQEGGPDIVESAVIRGRDALGRLLGSYLSEQAKASFDPASFRFINFKQDLMAVAARQDSAVSGALARPTLTGAQKARVVDQCFTWRGI